MSTYDTLVGRGNIRGVAVRPSRSDSYWPPAGTRVSWVVAQPIQDMLDQGRALGWGNSGTIGNTDHLRKHGDHTPWSAGKTRGVVYAKDTQDPSWLESALIAVCKSDYDTRWIHFWNCNGSQYNYAGQRVASSGDHHLHISVRAGYELTRTTLFRDLDRYHRTGSMTPTPTPPEDTVADLNPGQNIPLTGSSFMKTHPQFKGRGAVQDGLLLQTCLTEGWGFGELAVKALERVEAKLAQVQAPELDYAKLAKAVVDEFYARNTTA